VKMSNYNDFKIEAESAARKAGRVIIKALAENLNQNIFTKENSSDLVTDTDKECERLIISHLSSKFPNHKFIGEETSFEDKDTEITDDYTWVIDPLDGTTNFVHSYYFVTVSIGLIYKQKPIVGVIYNPILDRLYSAYENGGAFCNGKKY